MADPTSFHGAPANEPIRAPSNNLAITDARTLTAAAQLTTAFNLGRLQSAPVRGSFNDEHYLKINEAIFKDVYRYAGLYRSDPVPVDRGDDARFYKGNLIPSHLRDALKDASKDFRSVSRDDFVDGASVLFAELQYLQPAAEGNGRTTTEYLRTLGLHAGYKVQFSRADPAALRAAAVTALDDVQGGMNGIREQLSRAVVNDTPDRELQQRWDRYVSGQTASLKGPLQVVPVERGSLTWAAAEATRDKDTREVAFVSPEWPSQVRVLVYDLRDMKDLESRFERVFPARDPSVYAPTPQGAIRDTSVGQEVFHRVDLEAALAGKYPARLNEALLDHFQQQGDRPSMRGPALRGPEMDP